MSAIWGYISKAKSIDNSIISGMNASMSEYKLDRIEQISQNSVFFVCGHQYITNQAVTDVSPIYDSSRNLYFTADCFLYNRDAIISTLTKHPNFSRLIQSNSLNICGDAQLAFYAFQLLGYSFVNILRGSFSIAIYDEIGKNLHLYTDHLSKRYLTYYVGDNYVCFATTYKPIKFCLGNQLELNRQFIINSYRDMGPMNFAEAGYTVYRNVFHVDNATHVTICLDTQKIKKEIYWNPIRSVKKLRNKSDNEYKDIFLKTYESIIQAQLRARKQTGIMLSGGLDSASIVAYAAPYLNKEGKKLYSYTSVPTSQYSSTGDTTIIENETSLIKEQCKWHANLCPRYITSDSVNCMTNMEQFQREYDIPVKPSINNVNIDMMGKAASEDDCSILLSGANGNSSVSYGNIGSYLSLSLQQGHLRQLLHEVKVLCYHNNLSLNKFFRNWIKVILHYILISPEKTTCFLYAKDIKKYNLSNIAKKSKKKYGDREFTTLRQKYNFMYMPMLYIQKGFYYTCQGLLHGYLQLDPTLTVEMIELCISLPDECFVHNGVERRLIRDYMKDLIPPSILDVRKGVGIQAADFAYRVNRDWDNVKESVFDILNEPLLREYLDEKKLFELLEEIQEHEYALDKPLVLYVTLIGSLGYFLRDFIGLKK